MDSLNAVETFFLPQTPTRLVTHHVQYPKGTTHVYSYFESRGGKFDETCFFGLQYIIKRWLLGPVVNAQMVRQAKYFYKVHFGGMDVFNEQGWMHIVERHNGYLPVRIKAVPEGSVVGVRNVLFTVENTDPTVPWLTTWLETLLLQHQLKSPETDNCRKPAGDFWVTRWSAIQIARLWLSWMHIRRENRLLEFQSAAIGGAAHLVNFVGTDTIPGLQLCRKYYHSPMSGFSIPAAEHSTITSWQKSGESAAYLNMLEQFPVGLVSVVSDSYDIYNAVSCIWGDELKAYVMERADKGCLVIRPDSGDPTEVVLKVLNLLADKFPTTTNSNGYKVLPSYLRVMQGDGICLESLKEIIDGLKKEGWSVENVVFGTGGALLQKIDRDTQRCAYKFLGSPSTMSSTMSLNIHNGYNSYVTIQEGRGDENKDELVCVYENGRLLVDYSLDEIRQRAEISLVRKFVNSNTAVKTSNNSTNGVARTPASNGRQLRETSFR
uniref:Nicotinamide phosphoribosyltransferase n=1 Tax=Ditylenchus dipsaci TaxID=166011 RepID=A0A915EHV3_9BILA